MGRPTPVVLVVLIALLAVYLAVGFALNFAQSVGGPVFEATILNADRVVGAGEVWRLLTYGLLHDPERPTHLLWNGLALYFFGPDLERRFGRLRFVLFLAGTIVVGGVFVVAGHALGLPANVCLGFSAACEACVVAWALFNKDAQVLLMFMLPVRGIYMLAFAILMWMLDAVSTSNISASAHLGGIVTGALVWLVVTRRRAIFARFPRRGPKLTVVPKKDHWVN